MSLCMINYFFRHSERVAGDLILTIGALKPRIHLAAQDVVLEVGLTVSDVPAGFPF